MDMKALLAALLDIVKDDKRDLDGLYAPVSSAQMVVKTETGYHGVASAHVEMLDEQEVVVIETL